MAKRLNKIGEFDTPIGWQKIEFGKVFNFLKTFSYSREFLTGLETRDKIRIIHYGDIHAKYRSDVLDLGKNNVPYLKDSFIQLDSFDDVDFPSLKDSDLIIADASEDYTGLCESIELKNVNNHKVVGGLHTFVARAKKKNTIAPGFATFILKNHFVIREIWRIATGISVYSVSKNNLSKLKIILPPLPEQKAIARILTTMDELINKNNLLISKKEERKKWLMQQLLTGKKRLKGFKGEWKEIKLGEVGVFSKGMGITKDELLDFDIPCITYGEIYTTHNFVLRKFKSYINEQSAKLSTLIQKNDILFAGSGETLEEIGKAVAYLKKEIAYAGGDIIIYKPNKQIDSGFISYQLETNFAKRQKRKLGQGHSVVHIYKRDLATLTIFLTTLEEQGKIMNVIDSAENEIQLLKSKSQKLKEKKKWLMQSLLTGKVRVAYKHKNK